MPPPSSRMVLSTTLPAHQLGAAKHAPATGAPLSKHTSGKMVPRTRAFNFEFGEPQPVAAKGVVAASGGSAASGASGGGGDESADEQSDGDGVGSADFYLDDLASAVVPMVDDFDRQLGGRGVSPLAPRATPAAQRGGQASANTPVPANTPTASSALLALSGLV